MVGTTAALGGALSAPLLGGIALWWLDRWRRVREDIAIWWRLRNRDRSLDRIAAERQRLVRAIDLTLERMQSAG
jgi:hypothetical protein